jgi:hypothetical protein
MRNLLGDGRGWLRDGRALGDDRDGPSQGIICDFCDLRSQIYQLPWERGIDDPAASEDAGPTVNDTRGRAGLDARKRC